MMKEIHRIWLPESDTHFDNYISVGADAVDGKGTYQLKKYRAAKEFVKNFGLAIDIGAHVGLWSRVMAHDFEQVMAFEPLRTHIDCFQRNMHGLMNVSLFAYALSDRPDELTIHMPPDNTGHSHVSSTGERVRAVKLDSFRIDRRIDFMKIDVEGWELPVIEGAYETIMSDRPVIIIEQKPHGNAERYGWKQHAAVEKLKAWGYVERKVISGDHILTHRD
jgi:FkbM family methyltransferase